MSKKTKVLLIKALVYGILGFGIAFVWHLLKS